MKCQEIDKHIKCWKPNQQTPSQKFDQQIKCQKSDQERSFTWYNLNEFYNYLKFDVSIKFENFRVVEEKMNISYLQN
jgi:hypothetical protein